MDFDICLESISMLANCFAGASSTQHVWTSGSIVKLQALLDSFIFFIVLFDNWTVTAVEKDKAFGQEVKADASCIEDNRSVLIGKAASVVTTEVCTPKPHTVAKDEKIGVQKQETARKIASLIKNSSALKPKNQSQSSNAKSSVKRNTAKKDTAAKNISGTPNLAQENQATKRQKLEGGMTRQTRQILRF